MTENEEQSCARKSTAAKVGKIAVFAVIGAIGGLFLGDLMSGTALGTAGGILLSGGG